VPSGRLVLLRHGESTWNAEDRFAGWADIPLSDVGRKEAVRAGHALAHAGLLPDVVHTSLLRRAVTTADLALDAADRHWIPVRRDWRLNERHYGALQGMRRADVHAAFGDELTMAWRRSYDTPPPPLPDPQPGEPAAESLRDVLARLLPYWRSAVLPDVRAGLTVLVVAHGNVFRGLIAHQEQLPEPAIRGIEVPTGVPLRYDLDSHGLPVVPGGVPLAL
jgi:2,3-bisphosphoglycerate-dependent phosphoglycerate mutase